MACVQCGMPAQGDRCAMCAQVDRCEARHGDHVPEPEAEAGTDDEESSATDDWTVEQRGLDGGRHSGQATLDGGLATSEVSPDGD